MKKKINKYIVSFLSNQALKTIEDRKRDLIIRKTIREFDLFNTGIVINLDKLEKIGYEIAEKLLTQSKRKKK